MFNYSSNIIIFNALLISRSVHQLNFHFLTPSTAKPSEKSP